jgi:enamine deaminase RidA (YjgF/YER057c/UK114 family)
MKKRILINPPGTEKIYEKLQFSQAVQVGDTVWVSGQVGMDETGLACGRRYKAGFSPTSGRDKGNRDDRKWIGIIIWK